ncbi:MAG: DUF4388 domain-containing protein [Acidimicrobiia bacterium]
MSLSGNLGFVSLDEVLRLLTRSKQRGAVDVRGEKVRGRVFVDRGGVSLATTFTDESLYRHLIKSGLIDSAKLGTISTGGADLSSITDQDGGALSALLREMSVESIYQLGLQGETFEVVESETSPYANPKPFELEDLIADSKQRFTDWVEVKAIISDLDRNLEFRHELGDRDQVTIAKDAWRLLSEVGRGSSVRALADELGTTEFWTARIAAGLVEDELLAMETVEATPTHVREPVASFETAPIEYAEPVSGANGSTEPLESEVHVDPNQSWWREPVAGETSDEVEPDADQAIAAAIEGDQAWGESQPAVESPVETRDTTGHAEVEEDTEAFLEKVFSDMEPAEEPDEGYGLLRRRRMGTLRDLSNE